MASPPSSSSSGDESTHAESTRALRPAPSNAPLAPVQQRQQSSHCARYKRRQHQGRRINASETALVNRSAHELRHATSTNVAEQHYELDSWLGQQRAKLNAGTRAHYSPPVERAVIAIDARRRRAELPSSSAALLQRNHSLNQRSPMERRIANRATQQSKGAHGVSGLVPASASYLSQRSQSYKELNRCLPPVSHSPPRCPACRGEPLCAPTYQQHGVCARNAHLDISNAEAVTRWTSQILAQIDSLPNLEQVGLEENESNVVASQVSLFAVAVRKHLSLLIGCTTGTLFETPYQ